MGDCYNTHYILSCVNSVTLGLSKFPVTKCCDQSYTLQKQLWLYVGGLLPSSVCTVLYLLEFEVNLQII